jgi:acylphosphatase
MKRLIAHISGKVHGVGYRSMVVNLAGILDIKGYIEILPDGKAFIIAEGPKEDLARFVRAIRIDNAKIRVDEILIDCKKATGEFGNFHKILSRQEMKLQPHEENKKNTRKEGKSIIIGNFLHAPLALERVDREICRANHKLEEAESGLVHQEDAIGLRQEETVLEAAGRCQVCRECRSFGWQSNEAKSRSGKKQFEAELSLNK